MNPKKKTNAMQYLRVGKSFLVYSFTDVEHLGHLLIFKRYKK